MTLSFLSSVLLFMLISLMGTRTIAQGKVSAISKQMALHSSVMHHDPRICRSVPGLTGRQLDLCFREPDTVRAAVAGLKQALQECQRQLHGHRWNCSSLAGREKNPHGAAIMHHGYRETAFIHSLSAAAVAIAVSKSCIEGSLMNCGCDGKKYKRKGSKHGWKWGGCSHNVKYGVRFSKMFLDARERKEDTMHSIINLHNNKIGRMAVSNNMQLKCKCHGISGSCELKTCWRTVPDIRFVGKVLKERFKSAILVDQSNTVNRIPNKLKRRNSRKRKRPRPKLRTLTRTNKRDLSMDLVYYQLSPDFCEPSASLEIPGTTGRRCNNTRTSGVDSCSSLCCGRGYDLLGEHRRERCNCVFHWCCTVECQICDVHEWISVCK